MVIEFVQADPVTRDLVVVGTVSWNDEDGVSFVAPDGIKALILAGAIGAGGKGYFPTDGAAFMDALLVQYGRGSYLWTRPAEDTTA